jgi:hypothetical protein
MTPGTGSQQVEKRHSAFWRVTSWSKRGEKTSAMISMIHDATLGNTGRKDRKTNL